MLEAGDVTVTILSLGCITHDWRVPLGAGRVPVLQSFADPAEHLRHPEAYMGAIAGRVANRIGGARFSLAGQEITVVANKGTNQLHGGPLGLSRQNWQMERGGRASVRLTHRSPNGAQGFPGNVDFTTTITLDGARLTYEMQAMPDRPTPINLAQHSYYNLMGGGDIGAHRLHINAASYTPVDKNMLPLGTIEPLNGTGLDFRNARPLLGADIDNNLVLGVGAGPAATLTAPNGLGLKLWTDQPGLQLCTARNLSATAPALAGQTHGPFAGVCLEPQHFPDSVNNPNFPSIICTPEQPYSQKLVVEIKELIP